MGLPPANLVLFFLSGFVGLWGVSVVVRGLRAGRAPGTRRCPECMTDMRTVAGRRCPACEFETASEEELQERVAAEGVVSIGLLASLAGVALVPFALVVRSWETPLDAETLHPLHAVFAGVGAFGLALAAWGWRGEPARGRRRCPRCWYDMSRLRGAAGEVVLVCPECGHHAGVERRLYRARRRRRAIWTGAGLVLVGWCGQTVPRGLRDGWLGLVPTTVLIAGADLLPECWYLEIGQGDGPTLQGRIWHGELWSWQRRWAQARARSRMATGISFDRAVIFASMLDREDPTDHAAAILGCSRLLAEDQARAQRDFQRLYQAFHGLVYWGSGAEWEREAPRVRAAVRAWLPELTNHIETGGEVEAVLALYAISSLNELPPEIVAPLQGCVHRGDASSSRVAMLLLGRAADEHEAARDAIEELLTDEDAGVRELGVWAARATGNRGRQSMLETLGRIIETAGDHDVVVDAAEALADQGLENDVIRRILDDRGLSSAARAGMARSWAPGAVDAGEVTRIVLPALTSDDMSDVNSAIGFLRARLVDQSLPATEVVAALAPMLGHPDALAKARAGVLLHRLGEYRPELNSAVEQAFEEAGLDREDYDRKSFFHER